MGIPEVTGSLKFRTDVRDRYDLLAKLGSGGMADVFLGIQRGAEGFEQLVVIKRIKEARLSDKDDSLRMFVREARTVALLKHPHIVKVFDLCRMGDSLAIVMEYVDGENLEYLVRALAKVQGRLPLGILCRLMMQACEALNYAHTATTPDGQPMNLIHRDVGPHNLMIDSSGYLKVIDFGIAKTTVQMDLTSPGIIKGKLSYLAPDLFKFPDVDHRIDIYALGLVFYRLLTLKVPFDFKSNITVAELIRRVSTEQLPAPSKLVPELPSRLDDIVARATARDREQRYQSCEELGEDIRRFSVKHGGLASASEVKKWYTRVFRARIEKRRTFEKKVLEKAQQLAADKDRESRRAAENTSQLINVQNVSDPPQASGLESSSTTPSVQLPATWPPLPPGGRIQPEPRSARGKLWLLLVLVLAAGGASALVVSYLVKGRQPPAKPVPASVAADNLRVTSQPPGAAVFIDGQPAGNTGRQGLLATIARGREHLIEVRRKGYAPYQLKATGQHEGRLEVVARLSKLAAPQPPTRPGGREDKPAAVGKRPRQRRSSRHRQDRRPGRRASGGVAGREETRPAPAPQPQQPRSARPGEPVAAADTVASLPPPAAVEPMAGESGKPAKERKPVDRKDESRDDSQQVAAVSPQPPPQEPPEPPEPPRVKLLSGSGDWSGKQVLERGCGSCHASGKAKPFSADDKSRRQWQFFFRRHRHNRHARLADLFSRQELDRALKTILSRMAKRDKTGIAGER